MHKSPLAKFGRGAALERELWKLAPGQCIRMTAATFDNVSVPANPLDRQTVEFLVHWFKVRMPFYCTLHFDEDGRYWEICRPDE